MATLSELLNEKNEIELMLIDAGGELTPEIMERMDSNEHDMATKVDNYHALISKLTYGDAEIDAEIKRLQALKKTKANAVKNIKEHLLFNMKESGLERIEGLTCKVFRKATAESVSIEDEMALLSKYNFDVDTIKVQNEWPSWVKVSVDVDKTALKAAIKETPVAGCSLTRGECIQFK